MRTQNDSLISAPISISGTWVSEPVWVNQDMAFSLQLTFESAIASCKIQVSNDNGRSQGQAPSGYKVTSWNDLDGSYTTMSGNGTGTYNVSEVNYAWIRVVIDGDLDLKTLRFNGKGV